MSRTFASGAPFFAGLAARMLGWRPGEFWGATPDELAACLSSPHESGAPMMCRADFEILLEREKDG